VHKRRNVEDHLPESMKKQAGRTMTTAYRCGHFERAKRMLAALARQLDKKYPSAAASLREGLDETLTVLRFGLPSGLERTLATTNAIEFVNSRIRKKTHNVTKWNGGHDGPALGRCRPRRHVAGRSAVRGSSGPERSIEVDPGFRTTG
ncbi:MAG: transposase, partial [Myxococcota bacterium]|nr:transposase [Myxococcota bacterium]